MATAVTLMARLHGVVEPAVMKHLARRSCLTQSMVDAPKAAYMALSGPTITAVAPCVANWPQMRLLLRPSMTTCCGPVTWPVTGL